MENHRSTTKHVLILLVIFIVGLAFRLIRLGHLSLSNHEAELALQALSVARGEQTLFGDHAAYVGFTGLFFYLFGSSNFLARLMPALSGALIVFVPFLYAKQIGRWPALLGAFVLAISPDMVGLSRLIGTPMMALVFSLLAAGFWLKRKPTLTGVSLGLGLMSGQSFWVGLVILGGSLALSEWWFGVREVLLLEPIRQKKRFRVRLALGLVFTIGVVGTGFFMAPALLSGVFSGLFTFVLGFGTWGLVPIGWIPLALLVYGTGAVIFGLWGGIRGILIKSKLDMFLLLWAGFGLIFIVLHSGSGAPEMIWVTTPMWLLAGRVISLAWKSPGSSKLVAAITTTLVVVIAAFMALAMRTLITPALDQSQQINYLIALAGGVVLVVAVILLVSYGWSEEIARAGFLLGVGLVFLAGMVSVSVNASGLGLETPYEIWYPDEPVLLTEWLQVTVDRILVWNARRFGPLEIYVSGLDTPGLRWALHQYAELEFLPFVPPQSQPGMVITAAGVLVETAQAYQGQSLVWTRTVPWRDLSPSQYLTWLVTRDLPTIPQELILWVRTDMMPGGQLGE